MATVFGQQASFAQPAPEPESAMSTSMQRDFGLTASESKARLAAEDKAADVQKTLGKDLGASYGGSWFDADSGKLIVAVTSDSKAASVRSAGAEVRQVSHSEKQLDAYKAKLDKAKAKSPKTVPGWYVDVVSNSIVLQSRSNALPAAKAFVKSAGVPADVVTVKKSKEAPRALINVVGGNAYYIGGSRCSVGFSVNGGFVTAGHCGSQGDSTTEPSGTFAGSSFPGNDYAYVQTGSGNTLIGGVNNYSGGTVAVQGSQDAAVGSSICRSGSTTGWHCGTIQARNATVTYPEGTITGLIRTSVCAEPGDSGGSAISGNQAQGVTSGGSGNCSSGGTTYFQPVNEILQAYGLSLVLG